MSEFEEDLVNVMGSFIETNLDYIEKSNNELEQLRQENWQLKEKLEDAKLSREIARGHRKEVQDEELRQRRLKEEAIKQRDSYKNAFEKLQQKFKETNKGLNKVLKSRKVWKNRYYRKKDKADLYKSVIDELRLYLEEEKKYCREMEFECCVEELEKVYEKIQELTRSGSDKKC